MSSCKLKFILLLIPLIVVTFLVGCNNSKGGEDALTVFDVNSSKVLITYNNKTTALSDDKQKEFVSLIKSIYKDTDVKDDSTTKYDMKIDFNNGNVGEVSTDKKVFKFQNNVKKISDEDLNSLLEYVK
ncbi:hypothetical protein [Ruminococcus bovis]|uniref:Lipoprotein n=2 Tax=Ruminococcus TaxID=1263 RepID=A0A4P8XUD9_9FIRM|nr:hypothetical protein [Ruminococcus bovis]MEE3438686.1 hypothetical protein [Ruminococcus sp.]QCT05964.1 hypothetical protein E5Z56_00650 [Ruminococcus bovis]